MTEIYIVMAVNVNAQGYVGETNVIKAFNNGFEAIDFRDKMNETNGTHFSYYIEETELISEDNKEEIDYGEAGCYPNMRK